MKTENVTSSDIKAVLDRLTSNSVSGTGAAARIVVGNPNKPVHRILIALDVTEDVVAEAVQGQADLIIAHHPLVSAPLEQLTTDTPQGRMLSTLYRHDIAVLITHDCSDAVLAGLDDCLCQRFGIQDTELMKIISYEKCYKLVTCIPVLPEDYTAQIRESLGALGLQDGPAGAGVIGDYSHVCDYVKGIQNFVPLESAHPFIGTPGVMESVEVDRLEMIVPEGMLDEVVNTLLEVHPYEEVEYDLYLLHETRNAKGFGRIGTLQAAMPLSEVVKTVKHKLSQPTVRVVGSPAKPISKIAVCAGAKGSLVRAAHEKGADLLITGEVSFFEARLAQDLGVAIIDAGHWGTEFTLISYIKDQLETTFNRNRQSVEVLESAIVTEPFIYI